ncbi:MAG: sulfite exporter TauE/SafE family protein [Tagaea sp.]|nr:sulfite exporter TauE/SafE family protein [Tagaea sp.]
MTDPLLLAFVVFVFLLGGLSKGVLGMGLPTITLGLLALAMAPVEAAALLIVPSLVTNFWQMLAGGRFAALCERLWPFLLMLVPSTVLAAGLLTGPLGRHAGLALGIVLLVYGALTLSGRQWRVAPANEKSTGAVCGLATGAVTGVTGVFVMPAVPYLNAIGLEKDELVQALGISFMVSTAALAVGLGHAGAFDLDAAIASLVALGPALAGMWLGQRVRARLSVATFRRVFFLFVLALGAYLVLKGIL